MRGHQKKIKQLCHCALSQYLPLALQQMLSSVRSVLVRLSGAEILMTMNVVKSIEDMINSSLKVCRKVVHVSDTNRYYVAGTAEWAKKNV